MDYILARRVLTHRMISETATNLHPGVAPSTITTNYSITTYIYTWLKLKDWKDTKRPTRAYTVYLKTFFNHQKFFEGHTSCERGITKHHAVFLALYVSLLFVTAQYQLFQPFSTDMNFTLMDPHWLIYLLWVNKYTQIISDKALVEIIIFLSTPPDSWGTKLYFDVKPCLHG